MNTNTIQIETGNLWRSPRLSATDPENITRIQDHVFSITLYPADNLSGIEREFKQLLRKLGWYAALKYRLDDMTVILGSLLIATGIAFIIGILGTYEELFKALILEKLEHAETGMLITTSALLILAIAFTPKLLSTAEGESQVKETMRSWYNKDARVRRRLRYAIRLLCNRPGHSLCIWNPFASGADTWLWRALVPEALKLDIPLYFHIKNDEQDILINILRSINHSITIEFPPSGTTKITHFPGQQLNTKIQKELLNLISMQDRTLLELFLLLSTHNLPSNWYEDEHTSGISGLFSLELISYVVSRYGAHITTASGEIDSKYLYIFFRRCIHDYGFIVPTTQDGDQYWRLKPDILAAISMLAVRLRHPYIQRYIETEVSDVIVHQNDPAGLWIVYMLMENSEVSAKIKANILISIIERTRAAEAYFLMAYFKLLSRYAPEDTNYLRMLPLATLKQLIPLMERAGDFVKALEISDYLKPTNTLSFALITARLTERMGKYQESLTQLKGIEIPLAMKSFQADLYELAELKWNLHSSWVIVSWRNREEKTFGLDCIKKARACITRLSTLGVDIEPASLWHLHNTQANYDEWNGDLPAAIQNHNNCLQLPGIERKWISGSYVNLGIAHREQFLAGGEHAELDLAIDFARKGVAMKTSLGDHDELPIALHNLALSLLFKAKTPVDQQTLNDTLNLAVEHATMGITLINKTGSTKKQGHLYAELCIAEKLLGSGQPAALSRSQLLAWMSSCVQSGKQTDLADVKNIIAKFALSDYLLD